MYLKKIFFFSTGFSIFSSSSFPFSPSPSFSLSLPLFPSPSSLFHLFFLSFRLSLPLFPSLFLSLEVFFFEGTACTVYLQDVRNDTTDCNQLYLYWNKEIYFFFNLGFAHSNVCNLLVHFLAETSDMIINKHTVRHPKTDNILFRLHPEVY